MITIRHRALILSVTRLAAIATAILMLTVLTVTRSQAAFSASTSNTANSFATDSVVITDDDTGSTLFTVAGLSPGNPVIECITLTYSGTALPAPILMYGTTTGTLDTYLDLTIEEGTGGSFGSCTGLPPTRPYSPTLSRTLRRHTRTGQMVSQ